MKKLLIIVVLMLTACPAFAGTGKGWEFLNGFIGRSKDLVDCRTTVTGNNVTGLEAAQIGFIGKNNFDVSSMSADQIKAIFKQ